MMTQAMYNEGISYAEQNFMDETANHLKVDKELIRSKFDLDDKKILDFGCGMGGMSLWYAKNFDCQVHGVDIDGHHVRIANDLKGRHDVRNVEFEVRNISGQANRGEIRFCRPERCGRAYPTPHFRKNICGTVQDDDNRMGAFSFPIHLGKALMPRTSTTLLVSLGVSLFQKPCC